MRTKRISALVIMAISLAGLVGCATSEVPQTIRETQQTITLNIDFYQISSYQVTLTTPSSWTVDTKALTISKGKSSFFFDPDYSTNETPNPNVEYSKVTTNNGETLSVTVTTNKDDPSQNALVYIEDYSASMQDPNFHFSFAAPIDDMDSEFYDIVKTISWIRI